MNILKLSSVFLLLLLIIIVSVIFYLLGPMYQTGSPIVDAVAVIIGLVALMIGFIPQPNASSNSTQFYSRTHVIASAGIPILAIAILHTVLSIVLSYDLTLMYLILLGIIIVYFGFRILAVGLGTSIQIASDERHQILKDSRKNLVEIVEIPANKLHSEILAMQLQDSVVQQEAISIIKNVLLALKGIPANRMNDPQLPALLSNWAVNLELATARIKSLSTEEDKIIFLKDVIQKSKDILSYIRK